ICRQSRRLHGLASLRHAGKPDQEERRYRSAPDHQDGHRGWGMGFATRGSGGTAGVDSSDHDGDARLRRSEDCRSAAQAEAELPSCEPPLQQLVVYAEGRAAARMGVSGALGKQTHRRARSRRTLSRTDESSKRARLANMARLSVAHIAVGALRLTAVVRKIFLDGLVCEGRSDARRTHDTL